MRLSTRHLICAPERRSCCSGHGLPGGIRRDEAGVGDANHGYAKYWRVFDADREAPRIDARLGRNDGHRRLHGAPACWRQGVVAEAPASTVALMATLHVRLIVVAEW